MGMVVGCGIGRPDGEIVAGLGGASGLAIALASPDAIRAWSSGEVASPDTLDALTGRPVPGGLYCERIFGAWRDWECGCGRLKGRAHAGRTCDACGVLVGRSAVRRERMGHVELASPIVHPWFLRGAPGPIALLLDVAPRALERVVRHEAWLVVAVDGDRRAAARAALDRELAADLAALDDDRAEILAAVDARRAAGALGDRAASAARARWRAEFAAERNALVAERDRRAAAWAALRPGAVLTDAARAALPEEVRACARIGMGGAAIREALAALDLAAEAARARECLAAAEDSGPAGIGRAGKRLRLLESLRRAGVRPEWMVLTALPVLPPDLRPLVPLDGGRYAASDLSDLYRRVIARNARVRRLAGRAAPAIMVRNELRLLQEAVDALIDNGRRPRPTLGRATGAPLRSLSDLIRGKGGRFRLNLLGKRVDYSGRSVIAVGPTLRLGQCGLPRRLALELFKPFVMRALLAGGIAESARGAKRLVEGVDERCWPLLEEVMRGRLVLLNRAPTLHMGSLQAFAPVLLGPRWGPAIRLHPLACKGFNADFDGDQMAVHLPLSAAAQAEARERLHARANLLSAATGAPAIVPQQDIVLGCYYLTLPRGGARGEGKTFADPDELALACDCGVVEVGAAVRVRLRGEAGLRSTTAGRVLFHEALREALAGHGAGVAALGFRDETMGAGALARLLADCHRRLGGEAMADLADALKELGFRWSTRAALSVGWADLPRPPERGALIAAADAEAAAARADYERGILSAGERRDAIIRIWTAARDRVAAAVRAALDAQDALCIMVDSGARGNFNQINQMAGMRGLINDASGRIIERPIRANYREGIPATQYFLMSSGARKGATDRSLRTADAGYLTRRLVDVAQGVTITEEDCGDRAGLAIPLAPAGGRPDPDRDRHLAARLTGRSLAAGAELTEGLVARLLSVSPRPDALRVRSPLTCAARAGLCRRCYGRDLATGRPVALGAAVGVVAAQSIGEPGTQLTMKTFQLGGVASAANITSGLPRVAELFEAARPQGAALLAECAGRVTVEEGPADRAVVVTPEGHGESGPGVRHAVPPGAGLLVTTGDRVAIGQPLTAGHRDPREVLRLGGRAAAEAYLVGEVAEVYRSQGVDTHAKHIEVIVRQMTRRARVEDGGDTALLPGELVERGDLAAINAAATAAGGRAATAREVLLGITAAALATPSFLSAASFQEATRVLAEAALSGRVDRLRGLKENVIIGRPIPAGTGFRPARAAGPPTVRAADERAVAAD